MALTKLPRKNSNVGKDFYAVLARACSASAEVREGAKLAWAIYQEKFKLEADGLKVTHPIDLDFLNEYLGYSQRGKIVALAKRELDENADFIAFTEVSADKDCLNFSNEKMKHGRGGSEMIKYHLTTQAALQVAMAANTETARKVRKFIAAFIDSCIEQMHEKAEAKITPTQKLVLKLGKSELALQGLLAKAFAMVGLRMQAETPYGNAIADFTRQLWLVKQVFEVKADVVGLELLQEEYEHFKANAERARFKVCQKLIFMAPAYTDEAKAFAENIGVHALQLQTFACLAKANKSRLDAKWANKNLTVRDKMLQQHHQVFDAIDDLCNLRNQLAKQE